MELDPTTYLDVDDAALEARWQVLAAWLEERFEREITIEAALFLVGVQSRGQGYEPRLERELKESVIMEGTYCVFACLGLYERAGMDAEGFWLWERMASLPTLSVDDQEKLLRIAILRYFEDYLELEAD